MMQASKKISNHFGNHKYIILDVRGELLEKI